MSATRLVRTARPLATVSTRRLLSTTPRAMAEGDTGSGSSRPGGVAQGDAFTRREKGNEDYFIQQHEREKMQALREKLKEANKHINDLDKHIQEVSKSSGGQGE